MMSGNISSSKAGIMFFQYPPANFHSDFHFLAPQNDSEIRYNGMQTKNRMNPRIDKDSMIATNDRKNWRKREIAFSTVSRSKN
ncbi:hypothetical protein CIG75_00405 [Tumebacillus algifaecis]|uniref:Uncharacterized protein n=1 Tax=Tumebacillus algifaecis TaxID=1214604 RepID=A0A223CWJ9_9BACL|nr:hypothetical protein CIG75_00405 [Tumebacillus algifaecis]